MKISNENIVCIISFLNDLDRVLLLTKSLRDNGCNYRIIINVLDSKTLNKTPFNELNVEFTFIEGNDLNRVKPIILKDILLRNKKCKKIFYIDYNFYFFGKIDYLNQKSNEKSLTLFPNNVFKTLFYSDEFIANKNFEKELAYKEAKRIHDGIFSSKIFVLKNNEISIRFLNEWIARNTNNISSIIPDFLEDFISFECPTYNVNIENLDERVIIDKNGFYYVVTPFIYKIWTVKAAFDKLVCFNFEDNENFDRYMNGFHKKESAVYISKKEILDLLKMYNSNLKRFYKEMKGTL